MKKEKIARCFRGQGLAILLNALVWCLYGAALLQGKLIWNPQSLLRQTASMGFFVLGAGLEMTLGDIDLCFMAQASAGTLVLAALYRAGLPLPAATAALLLFECTVGAARGWLSARLHIPMIVSSFAMAQILSNLYAPGEPILVGLSLHGRFAGQQKLMAGLLLLCAVGLHFFWKKTYWGKYSMAVGENRAEAGRSGVDTLRVITVVYFLASLLFAMGTIMIFMVAPYGSGSRNADYLYQSLTAACLAGGLRSGSAGKAPKLLASTLSVVMLRQLLTAFGMTDYEMILEGIVILLTVSERNGRDTG